MSHRILLFFLLLCSLASWTNSLVKNGRHGISLLTRKISFVYALPQGGFSGLPKLPDLSQSEFPNIPNENEEGYNYDFVVFGSGPGGEAAAVQASKYGAKVAIIEKKAAFGGPTG